MKPHPLLLPFAASLLCVPLFISGQTPAPLAFPTVPATPPEKAASTFDVLDGFTMDLVAAEPLVTDPVAITYDEYGRAFVCEMNDYPYTDKAKHKPSQENSTDLPIGKVRLLTDTEGDGVYDRSTIFAHDLSWPTGAACWKGGIIVVATPDIWYLKDTDNDGVADVRQKLFTGLKKLNVQAVANNPIWGLDNKIYIAGGTNGGTVQNLIHPDEKPVTIRRSDLRLDPVTMKIEATDGGARFGNTRDDWGNRFLCNIRNPCQHVVLDSRYLSRNPYLPAVNPLHDSAEFGDQLPVHRISPPEAWRVLRADRWSNDPTNHMPRSELVGAGVVTSSAGITIYRGDAYPEGYRGMAFVADVAGNLFYRLKLTPDGVTFKATRVDGDKEFCASRDIWFRPVNFANAPDGCLHVCDMYREAIEHPWSLPDDIHAAIDLIKGIDKGRIWRLTPKGYKVRKIEPLADKSSAELVKLLAHPNAWHRDTAHRLLFERQDTAAVAELRTTLRESTSALARLHALWSLDGLWKFTDTDAVAAVHDADAHVREHATLLTEGLISAQLPSTPGAHSLAPEIVITATSGNSQSPAPALLRELASMTSDPDIRVRRQLALSLGSFTHTAAIKPLVTAVKNDLRDPWMRTALLSAPVDILAGSTATLLRDLPGSPEMETLMRDAGQVFGKCLSGGTTYMHLMNQGLFFLSALESQRDRVPRTVESGLEGLQASLGQANKSLMTSAIKPETKAWLTSVAKAKTDIALNASLPMEERTRAINLLALLEFASLREIAVKLLGPHEPDGIRLAAIQVLRPRRDDGVGTLLLEAWSTLTPAPREAALQALAGKKEWLDGLLGAIEAGRIKPAEISAAARALMLRTTDSTLKTRAEKLFSTSSRSEVLAKYQPALSTLGDATRGKLVFTTVCAVCHRFKDEGRDVGPNLATTLAWTPEQLLTNILDPNREVSPNFAQYVVELQDSRILIGMLTGESESSITMKGADAVEQSIARPQIKTLKSTGLSLMPEGLEAALTVEQLADLMAYLRTK
ncbi:PVC-type heme-binding CxxCH protein [Roseimicrobium sp. ORNL1]|uniref:PVC-type heme-binding CxxCH protein n=1 Tax=Roseimicrobium sp. ORNL1 TaxID=2711231 RepID=UPI0013E0F681|nr:PVC-type heme-binding CxxCH protein [Roseimicrobium sp. ORNL1]QIF01057.1 c-type cytochrome [Roseimicrobium sp. ORNL1]